MKINEKQLIAVTELPAPKRYSHFIKNVVDWEEAWGLFNDGWALLGGPNEEVVFPLWPAKEYAEYCAKGMWSHYEAKSIPLDSLVSELLPKLKQDGVLPGVFYTPAQGSVDVSIDRLLDDLREEMKNY